VEARNQEFLWDCEHWMTEIDELSRRTTSEAEQNMVRQIDCPRMLAIEATEDFAAN